MKDGRGGGDVEGPLLVKQFYFLAICVDERMNTCQRQVKP